jgi:hypothetical protein
MVKSTYEIAQKRYLCRGNGSKYIFPLKCRLGFTFAHLSMMGLFAFEFYSGIGSRLLWAVLFWSQTASILMVVWDTWTDDVADYATQEVRRLHPGWS